MLAGCNNNKCRVYDMYIETKIIYLQFTCSLQIEREKESIIKGITDTIKSNYCANYYKEKLRFKLERS